LGFEATYHWRDRWLHHSVSWLIMPAKQATRGRRVLMGDPQRLDDAEQLEILTLLEAASTERSAMRAARALAELMRHLNALGQRIAVELSNHGRNSRPTGR
jgi:hypothetical protein